MDSDTMLTLENTNDAIKRAENYMQRQDTDGDKRVAFSSAVDDSTDGHDEVNTLRATLKEKDQRLLALEAKFDSFSHGQTDGGNKRKKTAKKNEKECNYCKKTGKWFQGHDESECLHKKKDEAEAGLLALRRGVSAQSRGARRPKVTRNPWRLVLLLIKDQPPWRRLAMTSIQRCLQVPLLPHPTLSPFQRQLLLTSVVSAMVLSTLPHNFTCARAHAGRVSAFCSKESLAILSTPSAQMWFFQ